MNNLFLLCTFQRCMCVIIRRVKEIQKNILQIKKIIEKLLKVVANKNINTYRTKKKTTHYF